MFPNKETKEVEKVLNKISKKEPLCITEKDFKVIEEMVEEGLVKPDKEGYSLTDYGKVIEVMGYGAHQKKEVEEPINSRPKLGNTLIIFIAWLLAVMSILGCVFYLSY